MNRNLKKVVSLALAVFTALSCMVFASAADIVYGDVNGDVNINSSDALLVLQHSVQSIKLEGDRFTAADVNADGKINAGDALSILQYAVGIIDRFPADGAEDVIPAPQTKDEILALYKETVSGARTEVPAYKLRMVSEVTDADLSGSALVLMASSDVQKYKESLLKKSDYSNLLRADSQTALQNLPAACTVTDASKFKSITCKVLDDGNYQIDIVFKDESAPKAGSPIVTMLGLPDKETLSKTMQEEFDAELDDAFSGITDGDTSAMASMEIKTLEYVNCSISCVIDSQTGEFVSCRTSSDVNMVVKTVTLGFNLNTDTTTRTVLEYSNFVY